MPHQTIPHHTKLYHTFYIIPRRTIPYQTMPHHTILCHTILYHPVPHHTATYTNDIFTHAHTQTPTKTNMSVTMPYRTASYNTILWHGMACHPIPHTTPHSTTPTATHHTVPYLPTPGHFPSKSALHDFVRPLHDVRRHVLTVGGGAEDGTQVSNAGEGHVQGPRDRRRRESEDVHTRGQHLFDVQRSKRGV